MRTRMWQKTHLSSFIRLPPPIEILRVEVSGAAQYTWEWGGVMRRAKEHHPLNTEISPNTDTSSGPSFSWPRLDISMSSCPANDDEDDSDTEWLKLWLCWDRSWTAIFLVGRIMASNPIEFYLCAVNFWWRITTFWWDAAFSPDWSWARGDFGTDMLKKIQSLWICCNVDGRRFGIRINRIKMNSDFCH